MLGKGHGSGVKPAVHHLGHPMHGSSALGAGERHLVNIGPVQLHLCIFGITSKLRQLLPAAHTVLIAALAFPDIQRSSPVPVTGDGPVLNIFQPVAESSFADGIRDPVHSIVVADQIIPHSRLPDIPGFSGIIDQRGVASPTVRIAVLKFRRVKQKSLCLQILKNHGIGLLYKNTRIGSLRRHLSFTVHQLYKRKVIDASHLGIVFTEGRRNMHHAGAVRQCDIAVAYHIVSLLSLICTDFIGAVKQRLIFLIFQGLS